MHKIIRSINSYLQCQNVYNTACPFFGQHYALGDKGKGNAAVAYAGKDKRPGSLGSAHNPLFVVSNSDSDEMHASMSGKRDTCICTFGTDPGDYWPDDGQTTACQTLARTSEVCKLCLLWRVYHCILASVNLQLAGREGAAKIRTQADSHLALAGQEYCMGAVYCLCHLDLRKVFRPHP